MRGHLVRLRVWGLGGPPAGAAMLSLGESVNWSPRQEPRFLWTFPSGGSLV